ncbi:hypothetical protein HDU76_012685 [Blyttiomyces sp. JEL0837]|nr:hypothetical protein HDU76_012685 [Blyttiomyces sp. JEL0837]
MEAESMAADGAKALFEGHIRALRDGIDRYFHRQNFRQEESMIDLHTPVELSTTRDLLENLYETCYEGERYVQLLRQGGASRENALPFRVGIRNRQQQVRPEDRLGIFNIFDEYELFPLETILTVVSGDPPPLHARRTVNLVTLAQDVSSLATGSSVDLRNRLPMAGDLFVLTFRDFCMMFQGYLNAFACDPYQLVGLTMQRYLRLMLPRAHPLWRIMATGSSENRAETFQILWEWIVYAKDAYDRYLSSVPYRQNSFLRSKSNTLRPASLNILFEFEELTVWRPIPQNSDQNDSVAEVVTCAICQEDGTGYESFLVVPCNHSFQAHCLMNWLLRAHTCPCCRRVIPTDNEQYNAYLARQGHEVLRINRYNLAQTGGANPDHVPAQVGFNGRQMIDSDTDSDDDMHIAALHANDFGIDEMVSEHMSESDGVAEDVFERGYETDDEPIGLSAIQSLIEALVEDGDETHDEPIGLNAIGSIIQAIVDDFRIDEIVSEHMSESDGVPEVVFEDGYETDDESIGANAVESLEALVALVEDGDEAGEHPETPISDSSTIEDLEGLEQREVDREEEDGEEDGQEDDEEVEEEDPIGLHAIEGFARLDAHVYDAGYFIQEEEIDEFDGQVQRVDKCLWERDQVLPRVISDEEIEEMCTLQLARDAFNSSINTTASATIFNGVIPGLRDVFEMKYSQFLELFTRYCNERTQSERLSTDTIERLFALLTPPSEWIARLVNEAIQLREQDMGEVFFTWANLLLAKRVIDFYVTSIPLRTAVFQFDETTNDRSPRPASLDSLFQLEIVERHQVANLEFDGECTCGICQKEEKLVEKFLLMPCGHQFHIHCLSRWLMSSHSCFTCGCEIYTDNEEVNRDIYRRANAGARPGMVVEDIVEGEVDNDSRENAAEEPGGEEFVGEEGWERIADEEIHGEGGLDFEFNNAGP